MRYVICSSTNLQIWIIKRGPSQSPKYTSFRPAMQFHAHCDISQSKRPFNIPHPRSGTLQGFTPAIQSTVLPPTGFDFDSDSAYGRLSDLRTSSLKPDLIMNQPQTRMNQYENNSMMNFSHEQFVQDAQCAKCVTECQAASCSATGMTSQCTDQCVIVACNDPAHEESTCRDTQHCDTTCEDDTDCPDCYGAGFEEFVRPPFCLPFSCFLRFFRGANISLFTASMLYRLPRIHIRSTSSSRLLLGESLSRRHGRV